MIKPSKYYRRVLSATGGNEELENKLLEIEELYQNNINAGTVENNITTTGSLLLSDFKYEYEKGGHSVELNENAVGGMNLSYTVKGPSSVRAVRIGGWHEAPFTEQEIYSNLESCENVWKKDWIEPEERKIPFSDGTSHPVDQEELGTKAYVLLIGLDKDCNVVGYTIVEEVIG